jgi:RNA polymerase sigma factor (sigma-70 family)
VSRQRETESIEQLKPLLDIVEQEVSRLTLRLPRHAYERDELVSCAFVGLCEARVRFRAEYGVPLGAYARLRIRGALVDGLRTTLGVVKRRQYEQLRRESALTEDRFGLEFRVQRLKRAAAEAYKVSRTPATPEGSVLEAESKAQVRAAIDMLQPIERSLVRSLFGFDCDEESGEALAQRMGRHRSSVCRQKHKVLARLREAMSERGDLSGSDGPLHRPSRPQPGQTRRLQPRGAALRSVRGTSKRTTRV